MFKSPHLQANWKMTDNIWTLNLVIQMQTPEEQEGFRAGRSYRACLTSDVSG